MNSWVYRLIQCCGHSWNTIAETRRITWEEAIQGLNKRV
uniref:Uncharacterized protein n=1 Tax=Kalanchoe fedtschenkoi TaxID=63787 RepID=A0A7N0VIQ2_KALFE